MHLTNLDQSITSFMQQYPYAIGQDFDDTSLDHTTMVIRIGPFVPRTEWPLQIGDVLHNIRIALDHAAFRVVKHYDNAAPDDQIAFPICSTNESFESRTKRFLKAVPPRVSNAFRDFQPFPERAQNAVVLLRLLDDLENVHKHRYPLAAFPGLDSISFTVNNDPEKRLRVEQLVDEGGALVDGRPVARCHYNGNTEATIDWAVQFEILFDTAVTGPGQVVLRTLWRLHKYVEGTVFPALERLL